MSDLIRREDVENTIQRLCDLCGEEERSNGVMCGACNLDNFIRVLDDIPSVEAERKKGTWVVHDYALGRERYECTECRGRCDLEYNFCPNCGAEMTR